VVPLFGFIYKGGFFLFLKFFFVNFYKFFGITCRK
jgi:hypothetical protein